MTFAVLILAGLAAGSFINALVWRLRQQAVMKRKRQPVPAELSILTGRSLCPHCRQRLADRDLVPLLSWLALGGRCRHCHKPISRQYPLVEAGTAALFGLSYLWWPAPVEGTEAIRFGFWLLFLTGFMALAVYDLRWLRLPNRIVYPLIALAAAQWLIIWRFDGLDAIDGQAIGLGALVGGGIFYSLFQLSKGKWIGGGDVKLGFLLGLLIGDPLQTWLMLFLASSLGTAVTLPLMATGKANRQSRIPFGPFLLAAGVITILFGQRLLDGLDQLLLLS